MITLTRLSGSVFVLNSDLIERVDRTPDTVITLVDGTKYVVSESLDQIILAVQAYRGQVVALGTRIAEASEESGDRPVTGADRPALAPVSPIHQER